MWVTGSNGTTVVSGSLEILNQVYVPVNDKGNSGSGSTAFNWNDGNIQSITLTGPQTFTFSNPQSGANYQIIVTQDSTAGRTITWPTIYWEGDTTPTLTGTSGSIDVTTFVYDGSKYLGTIAKNFGTP
jgi:hypothetical protein